MKKLPDEEKAQAQTDGTHRIHGGSFASVGRIIGEIAAGVAGGFAGMVPFLL